MRLYLIRHGQSTNNAIWNQENFAKDRNHDPLLTEIGQQQAQHTAEFISTAIDMPAATAEPFDITHLYCSPMRRTLQTAYPISQLLGLTPEIWTDIHERGGIFLEQPDGHIKGYRGMSRSEIQTQYPDYVIPDSITEAGWWGE